MRLPPLRLAFAFLLIGAIRSTPPTPFRLAKIFGDGMVVQRGRSVVVWGWATSGADVSVRFRGRSATARAVGEDGAWRATLVAGEAGGPFELTVTSGADRVVLHDVLVGDVWIASGQSNMEWTVAQSDSAAAEIAGAHDSEIRQFKVPNSWANSPESDLAGGSWTRADRDHVGAFSGVAYYFAKALRKSVHVPIGIVNTTWSGSNIETWLSRDAQHLTDSAWNAITAAEASRDSVSRAALRAKIGGLPTVDSGLVNGDARWASPMLDDAAWSEMPVPSYWEGNGYPDMDGVAWYRTTIDLTAADASRGATLTMTAIDDDDITWMNGVEIGRTNGYSVRRRYAIPSSALHAGHNVLAVRVADGGGGGGINDSVSFQIGSDVRSLAGPWKFKVGAVRFGVDGQRINKIPTILYNKMVHPILPLAATGVIWYQGESNSNNDEQAAAYRGQFAALIESWRREFREASNMPFLWVQLPNFGIPESDPPAHAAWALQRESMDDELSLPKTGRAVIIDAGGPLHPTNKQTPGARLALVARHVAYGDTVLASGPEYRSHRVIGDTMVVEFDHLGEGLVTRHNDPRVGGFALAGADGVFKWADGRIVGNTVHVWSADVHAPVAVRYAWANNPIKANLYNRAGLPAAPFRR